MKHGGGVAALRHGRRGGRVRHVGAPPPLLEAARRGAGPRGRGPPHGLGARLGYFVNPLVNVLLGVLVLRERLGRAQWVAVALAAAGVAVVTLRHGRLPWIALALAVSFGLYGLARKTVGADGHLVVLGWRGSGAFGSSEAGLCALLALAGPVTAALLALFVFREPFTPAHAATFACIWTALAILTWDLRKRLRRAGVERRGGRAA